MIPNYIAAFELQCGHKAPLIWNFVQLSCRIEPGGLKNKGRELYNALCPSPSTGPIRKRFEPRPVRGAVERLFRIVSE